MNANGFGPDPTSHILGLDPSPRQLPIYLFIYLFIIGLRYNSADQNTFEWSQGIAYIRYHI